MGEFIFPLLGVPPNIQLLDPLTVFTPLMVVLVALCSLLGIAIGMCIDRVDTSQRRTTTRSEKSPLLPKAA